MEQAEQETPKIVVEDKQRRSLALLEAALYVAGRPLDLKTLCSVLKSRSEEKVRRLAKTLAEEYKTRDTSLEVLELADKRFVLQLKPDFTPHVRRLAIRPLLSTGPLKTLSYIALRQPIPQVRVIAVRGTHAYGHVKQLEELGLIVRERFRRGMIIRTTEVFADYFGLSHDMRAMKRQLGEVFKDYEQPESGS